MKKLLTTILFTSLLGFAQADTKFPKGTLEPKDLAKAKTEAAAAKKTIAFIYTDKSTTCPLCQDAAAAFVDAVRSKSVIVFVNTKDQENNWKLLPKAVQASLSGGGNFIPKIAVTDATAETTTASLSYTAYKADNRKSIRELKKALKAE
jgi:hypothetical protein